ncbi:MAG: putative sugar O-methyltransferase [Chlamydiales bacterium]|nr:putative sugar O-methyltransferase [Chlamydiales bacterium]
MIKNNLLGILSFFVWMSFTFSCLSFERTLTKEDEKTIISEANKHLEGYLRGDVSKSSSITWDEFLSRMRSDILNLHSVEDIVGYAQTRIAFDHRRKPSIEEITAYENTLMAEFPHFAKSIELMSDSCYSCSDSLCYYNGRPVNIVFYYHYRYILQCLSYIKNPKTICEIGSGYGAIARLWTLNPICASDMYILLDFPECLFFAEVFLKANFIHDEKVVVLHIDDVAPEELTHLSKLYKVILLCPVGKEKLLQSIPIDLVTNTGSMQEMTQEWIDYWMQWLDQSKAKYFYSLNYFGLEFTRKPSHSANTYAPRLSNQWVSLLKTTKVPFCPPFSVGSTFAEIIAERNPDAFSREALRSNFWVALDQKLDMQGFLDCLDILRLCPEEDLIWALVQKISYDMRCVPQETYYLVEWLKKHGSVSFLMDKSDLLNEYGNID